MLQVLAHRIYRHSFLAQVTALVGNGLTTVALALLAHDLVAGQAKMVAYVGCGHRVTGRSLRLASAALLMVMSFDVLFLLNSLAFLVVSVVLLSPQTADDEALSDWRKVSHGMRIYLKTPRL
mgnify:CR=1 FL=1